MRDPAMSVFRNANRTADERDCEVILSARWQVRPPSSPAIRLAEYTRSGSLSKLYVNEPPSNFFLYLQRSSGFDTQTIDSHGPLAWPRGGFFGPSVLFDSDTDNPKTDDNWISGFVTQC